MPGSRAWRVLCEYLLFATLATLALGPAAMRRRYQVVHIHNPPDFLIVAGLLPRLLGSRLILDVHDLSSHMFRSRFKGRAGHLAGRVLDLIERWAGRLADVLVTLHAALSPRTCGSRGAGRQTCRGDECHRRGCPVGGTTHADATEVGCVSGWLQRDHRSVVWRQPDRRCDRTNCAGASVRPSAHPRRRRRP